MFASICYQRCPMVKSRCHVAVVDDDQSVRKRSSACCARPVSTPKPSDQPRSFSPRYHRGRRYPTASCSTCRCPALAVSISRGRSCARADGFRSSSLPAMTDPAWRHAVWPPARAHTSQAARCPDAHGRDRSGDRSRFLRPYFRGHGGRALLASKKMYWTKIQLWLVRVPIHSMADIGLDQRGP